MKQHTPIDRSKLHIKRRDHVLEIGGGHNPMYRSNVIVEKYIDSNEHRGGNIRIFPHQLFINADGENLPFKDKEFDYVVCNQVLEHTEDPIAFITELQRVAQAGYIEVPSLIGESLFPKKSHKWVCLEINNHLVLYEKQKLPNFYPDFGRTFLNNLPYESLALRIFYHCYNQANVIRYEWKNSISLIVNPQDSYYQSFFTKDWDDAMSKTIFPSRSTISDLLVFSKATFFVLKNMIMNKLHRYKTISLEEYNLLKNIK